MDVDILKETQNIQDYWKPRDIQMLKDRDIVNLVKPTPTTDKIQWVSNEPDVFFKTSKALVSSYPPRFSLPLTINFTPEEKDKMNKAERFILGIFRSFDRNEENKGFGGGWLRQLAHWVLSGWYSVFTYIEKGDDIEFVADLWDPIMVYPEWSGRKLTKCIRTFEIDKRTALSMASTWKNKGLKFEFPEPKEKARIKVINYWLDDNGKIYNAITLGNQKSNLVVVKNLLPEKNFDHIPIFVGGIGSPEVTSTDWQTRRGEHIISSNRDMYEYENMMASLMATIMAETAYPELVSKTKTGVPVTKEGIKGYGEELALRMGESLELLKHAATPTEANVLLSWVGMKKQKGSIPDIVYGGVPFELSGFAISQLMAAIRYKLAPYLNAMQYVISSIATEFLMQYKKGKYPEVTLSTTNPKELKRGQFFVEEFSPSDVPKSLYVDVTIPITSAMDKTQQIIFARQAMAPPALMSRETLWDSELLDIQDSEQEYARILQDEMLELPIVKQIAMIEQLRVKVEAYRSEGNISAANVLNRYIMMLELQLGMRQGIPTKEGGIPPNVMPPEMGQSPDQTRSALGVPPPGLSRRPQTSQERAESKGRRGIVSPTGEQLL